MAESAKAKVLKVWPDAFAWSIMGDGIGISSHLANGCIGMTLDGDEAEAWQDACNRLPQEETNG